MADSLIVFGAGGHAKVVLEAALARDPARKVYIVDDDPEAIGRSILGIDVVGTRDWLSSNELSAPVALGIGQNRTRLEVLDWLCSQGRKVETVVHRSAHVAPSAKVGSGAFFSAGSTTIAEAQIGRGTIVNTGATIDHDCVLGEGVHVGPGANLCGGVRVGDRSIIGVGSAVRPGVTIAADVVIGAGSAVVCDLTEAGTYVGYPARLRR